MSETGWVCPVVYRNLRISRDSRAVLSRPWLWKADLIRPDVVLSKHSPSAAWERRDRRAPVEVCGAVREAPVAGQQ